MVWPFKKKEVKAVQTQATQPQPPIPQPMAKQKEEVLFQAGQTAQKTVKARETKVIRPAKPRLTEKHFRRKKTVHKKPAQRKLKFLKTKPQIRKEKDFRTAKLNFLSRQIKILQGKVYSYETQIEKLTKLIDSVDDYVVVKFLEDLSWEKFSRANRTLNIKKDDVIYVENTDTVSKKTLDYLRGNVTYILYRKRFNKTLDSEKFIFMEASKLQLRKYDNFLVGNAKEFEKAAKSKDILQKLLMGM